MSNFKLHTGIHTTNKQKAQNTGVSNFKLHTGIRITTLEYSKHPQILKKCLIMEILSCSLVNRSRKLWSSSLVYRQQPLQYRIFKHLYQLFSKDKLNHLKEEMWRFSGSKESRINVQGVYSSVRGIEAYSFAQPFRPIASALS